MVTAKERSPEEPRAPFWRTLSGMRFIATGLLIAMACVFVVARLHEGAHPAIGYARAFAEAAMVGALADWFAVTALFRRPLGLPIPHTAIIPRSKNRIGAGLARFIETNFLAPEIVRRELAGKDLAGAAARWLLAQGRARALAAMAADAAPRALAMVDDAPVSRLIADVAREGALRADAAALIADVLQTLTAENRHQNALDHFVRYADDYLRRNEADIRKRVSAETSMFWRLLTVDRRAADAVIDAAKTGISEVARDPDHEFRTRFTASVLELIYDLRTAPRLRSDVEAMKRGLIAHPDFQEFAAAVWRDLKQAIRSAASGPERAVVRQIEGALTGLAERLLKDDEARAVINAGLCDAIVSTAAARRQDVGRFVAETIQSWDARKVVEQMENAVGPDLQYIRLSGTLIGGLIGLALHAASTLIAQFAPLA